MGVLHITIPAGGGFIPRRPRVSPAKAPLQKSKQKLGLVPAPIVLRADENSQPQAPAQSGTLLPSSRPFEARLQRTPEQEAEQEAVSKLVRQCIAGDPQAWQQLVVSQHRRIYAICYRFTGSPTDAEDLTQDVFLKLYKNLSSFDTLKGSFQTWITTLARNLLVDHFRRTRLDRASDSLDATFDGEEDGPTMADRLADPRQSQEQHVAGLELKVQVQAALKQLSPELREAVILRDLEDMDYKEIAQVLRIPEGTVVRAALAAAAGNLQGFYNV